MQQAHAHRDDLLFDGLHVRQVQREEAVVRHELLEGEPGHLLYIGGPAEGAREVCVRIRNMDARQM